MADGQNEDGDEPQGSFLTRQGLNGILLSGAAGLAGGIATIAASGNLFPNLDYLTGFATGIWSIAMDRNRSLRQVPGRLGRAAVAGIGGFIAYNLGEWAPELLPPFAQELIREGGNAVRNYLF
ncbi:hypothetical protein HYV84_07105 [Candidatus Woesearchaeota archaeon]|nr:hypothetical protein [Candidatus Woesearchaeota archaeon]